MILDDLRPHPESRMMLDAVQAIPKAIRLEIAGKMERLDFEALAHDDGFIGLLALMMSAERYQEIGKL